MSTKLFFGRDTQGYNAFAPPPASDKDSVTLAAGGNATLTLPTNVSSWIISFSYQPGSLIWVAYNTSAAAPVGASFASTSSELLPGARTVSSLQSNGTSATTINLLNAGASSAQIGVSLYANA